MSENNNNQQNDNLINIGGLWANRSRKGEIYLNGYLNGAKIIILKNNFKETHNHPDYVMYIAHGKKRTESATTDDFESEIVINEQNALDTTDDNANAADTDNINDIPF